MGRGLTPTPWEPIGTFFDGSYPVNPMWDVSIPTVNSGEAQRTAAFHNRTTTGIWGYESTEFTLLNMADGTYTQLTDPLVDDNTNQLRSWLYDDEMQRVILTKDFTSTPDQPAIVYPSAVTTSGSLLNEILLWMSLRLGYLEADIFIDPELDDFVMGVLIDEPYSVDDLFGSMGKAYGFTYFESEGKIKFVKLNATGTGINITQEFNVSNMAPISEGEATGNEVLVTELGENADSPIGVDLSYIDPDADFVYSVATYLNNSAIQNNQGTHKESVSIPIVMTKTEAYQRVAKITLQIKEMSVSQQFRLPWAYLPVEPTDAVGITVGSYRYVVRVQDITFNDDWSLSVLGLNFNLNDDVVIDSDPVGGTIPQDLPGVSDSKALVLDTTLVSGDNAGTLAIVYTGVVGYGQPQWNGATFEEAATVGPFGEVYHTGNQTGHAICVGALPSHDPWTTDETNVMTLQLRNVTSDSFADTNHAGMLAGLNAVLVGAHGRWELIYFRDVTVISSKSVELRGLIRGKRGTDPNVGLHGATDDVYLVASVATGFINPMVPIFYGELDVDYRHRAVGDAISFDPPILTTTINGMSLHPWAPGHYKITLEAGNDLEITCKRRDRVTGAADWGEETPPLNEATEEYTLEILSGADVVRTASGLTSAEFLYTSDMQLSDGFTPPLTELKIKWYQMSAVVGRGLTREETVNVE